MGKYDRWKSGKRVGIEEICPFIHSANTQWGTTFLYTEVQGSTGDKHSCPQVYTLMCYWVLIYLFMSSLQHSF